MERYTWYRIRGSRSWGSIPEPPRGKTNNVVSEQVRHKPTCTVTEKSFGFKKNRKCTIRVAKTKALISFTVTAKLICVFVFCICRLLFFS